LRSSLDLARDGPERVDGSLCHAASCPRSGRQQLPAYALQVLGSIDANGIVCGFDCLNAVAVLERAQLLERFGSLERGLRKRWALQDECPAVAVQAEVLGGG